MIRHVQDETFSSDTRRYAFATLARLAKHDVSVRTNVLKLAEEIVHKGDDELKTAAARFLSDATEQGAAAPSEAPSPRHPSPHDESPATHINDEIVPIALSHAELGEVVCAALDNENYQIIVRLMAPPELIKNIATTEQEVRAYAEYVASITWLAQAYRSLLADAGLLPLTGSSLSRFEEIDELRREVGGRTIQFSTGIQVVNRRATESEVTFELVDQAFAIDGRWYIIRCMSGGGREKAQGKEAFAELTRL